MVSIKDMQILASKNGINKTGEPGLCLSHRYINDKTRLKWQCGKCGYIWEAPPNRIKKGKWCAKCAGNLKLTIKDMKILAKETGILKTGIPGKCLSEQYFNNKLPLKWQCGKCDYIWEAVPWNVRRGYWCRPCSGVKTYTIEDMRELAEEKGIEETNFPGKCLSDVYINKETPLEWQCGRCEYIWTAKPNNILRRSWCPNCSTGKMEKKTRRIFKEIFDESFPKSSPNWLINPLTNYKMHFDGYNRKMKLAFEYNGPQHYKYHKFFHKDYLEFVNQQKRDIYKKILCKAKGIILIVIPYTVDTENLRDYITTEYNNITGKTVYYDSTNN